MRPGGEGARNSSRLKNGRSLRIGAANLIMLWASHIMACHDANLDLLISFSGHVFGESQKTTARRSIYTTRERFALARTRTPCCRCELLIRTLRFGRRDRRIHTHTERNQLWNYAGPADDEMMLFRVPDTGARFKFIQQPTTPLSRPQGRIGSWLLLCWISHADIW